MRLLVPFPQPGGGISDADFLKRLSVLYGENFVADVAGQLDAARHEGGVEGGNLERVEEIKGRFTYRMHDLGQFMKGLMQRFCLRSAPATQFVRASSGARIRAGVHSGSTVGTSGRERCGSNGSKA